MQCFIPSEGGANSEACPHVTTRKNETFMRTARARGDVRLRREGVV